ncbi:probable G-protein coupled receptor 139 isoform X2 [Pygocentrus nattereri]|uniref:probable G-protein coupled receptor 139 isoform X2 n=1 Tax=Pygocentrus nattereri TaxID=42514 RepID=UPI0008144D80|nr:probable G-protein coupled receptor 139 isoform X2 [Pygocentrus nattereri]
MDGAIIFITFQKVYYPLLCILGIPANLFTFYMICFRSCGMSDSARIYLSCLALADTCYLVWVILLDLCLTFLQAQPFWHSSPWCGIINFLQFGTFYCSAWVVVAFTIERFLVLRVTVNMTLDGEAVSVPRCLYREAVYSTVVVWITSFLSSGVPIMLVLLFNSLIAHHLLCSSRLFTEEERRTIRGCRTRGSVRRTLMLLATVSVAFVVLTLPRFITYCILRTTYNHKNFNRDDYAIPINVVSDVANMLHNLNSSTNFLLYCMVSRRFRQELLNTLTCRAKARELGSLFTHTTMKVFSVAEHKYTPGRDPVSVMLTKLRYFQDSAPHDPPSAAVVSRTSDFSSTS